MFNTKYQNKLYILLSISIIIVIFTLFSLKFIHTKNTGKQKPLFVEPNISKVSISPSQTINTATNESVNSRDWPDMKSVKAYGLEITEHQAAELIKYLNAEQLEYEEIASAYFDRDDKWYMFDDLNYIQAHTLFIKKPYICQLVHLVCMTLPEDYVDEERERCLAENIDYNDFNDWYYSNSSHCCKTLVSDISYIFSCARIDRSQENPISEELLFAYKLLKDSGVDCLDYNCPPAIEKEIEYW